MSVKDDAPAKFVVSPATVEYPPDATASVWRFRGPTMCDNCERLHPYDIALWRSDGSEVGWLLDDRGRMRRQLAWWLRLTGAEFRSFSQADGEAQAVEHGVLSREQALAFLLEPFDRE